mgnify:CR=1 FL=1|jgi:iron complex transport system permease protein
MTTVSQKAKSIPPIQAYRQRLRRNTGIVIVLFLITLILAFFSLNSGSADTNTIQIISTLFGNPSSEISNIVVWNIRLPRIVAGMIAGAGLAVAGCVVQTVLKNPLASPSTLGISNAAAFGANIAILFLGAGGVSSSSKQIVSIQNPYLVSISAFIFSMVLTGLILTISRLRKFTPETVILAGVAFGSLFSAGSTLLQYFAEDVQVAAMVFWTFGDLGRVSWKEIGILGVVVLGASIYFLARRWDFNALDSGEEMAKSLGVNVEQVRFGGMLASSLITAVSVSFMGIISFVGLIAPQMMRRILGVDHKYLIPASAILGSVILLFSDTIARTIISPIVLPVGAITSFFGAPLFLFLLVKGYSKS